MRRRLAPRDAGDRIDMSDIATEPLSARFGVVVSCDLDTASDQDLAALRPLFERHSALLFRRQSLSDAGHLRLARVFGEIEDRNADTRAPGDAFEIPQVSNVTASGTSGDMDLQTLNLRANMLWHADSTFLPRPALANILVARTVTSTGGATELASTRAAFADMTAEEQAALRALRFRHHYAESRRKISAELAELPMFHKWPPQTWPAVWRNPVTGEEAVYVASHAYAVDGMADDAARAYLEALIARCTAPDYVYAHHWTVGDVLIWDQRAVLHRGTPWPLEEPRVLSSLCVSVTDADGLAAMRVAT